MRGEPDVQPSVEAEGLLDQVAKVGERLRNGIEAIGDPLVDHVRGSQLPQTRTARHRRIVDLLTRQPICSQSQLAKLLADDGLAVTQATLSRDPDELGTVKVSRLLESAQS